MMTSKKMLTRQDFEEKRLKCARDLAADKLLQKDALDVLVRADRHNWIHQTTWFGEPVLNLPQDMFALQELIFQTRPKFIIEVGVAWGGSLLFYSTLMEVLGGGKVVGIDIYIPEDLRQRLNSHGALSRRINLINASSVDSDTVEQVKSIVGGCREVLVILDSYHTHAHVLQELQIYSPFVGKGYNLVCGDTVVDDIPEQEHRERPWGPGNNPKTALKQFLQENDRFEIEKRIENKLLFTCNPDGYLVCIKD